MERGAGQTQDWASTLSVHVDDISVCISGSCAKAIVCAAGYLAKSLAAHVNLLGMKLDLGNKAFLMASSNELLVAAKWLWGFWVARRSRRLES